MRKTLIASTVMVLLLVSSGCNTCDMFRGSLWPWRRQQQPAPPMVACPPQVFYQPDCPPPCPPSIGACAPCDAATYAPIIPQAVGY